MNENKNEKVSKTEATGSPAIWTSRRTSKRTSRQTSRRASTWTPLLVPALTSALLLVLALGCAPSSTGSNNENETQNSNDTHDAAVTADGAVNGPDATIYIDADVGFDAQICGAQTEEIEIINLGDPPDLLIVLDRSGSMMLAPGINPMGTSKWQIMKESLQAVLDARDSNIRFGLTVFPTDDACGVDPGARVEIALNNGSAIVQYLNSTSPNGNTPAQFALQEALAYYGTIAPNPEGQYVLFATDGIPNCGGDPPNVDIDSNAETVQAVEDLAAAGIHTFVLGFGGLFGLDSQVLNDAAQAGLEPKPNGPPYFYHADDSATLQSALDTIAGGIITPSCSFELTSLPPEAEDVAVYFDGVAVPRSPGHNDGWDYHPDASTITFFGSYCDALQSGQVQDVDFIFGCPGPVVE